VSTGFSAEIDVQAIDPDGDWNPAGHAIHEDWPSAGWNVLTGQEVGPNAPTIETNEPGGAGVHAGALGVLEYVPTAQGVQVAPFTNVPAGQLSASYVNANWLDVSPATLTLTRAVCPGEPGGTMQVREVWLTAPDSGQFNVPTVTLTKPSPPPKLLP
jgi:hypothetical protein